MNEQGDIMEVPDVVPLLAVRGFGAPVEPVDLTGIDYRPGPDGRTVVPCPLIFEGLRGALHDGDHVHVTDAQSWIALVLHPDAVGDLIARCWAWSRQTGQEMRVRAAVDQVETALNRGHVL